MEYRWQFTNDVVGPHLKKDLMKRRCLRVQDRVDQAAPYLFHPGNQTLRHARRTVT